MCIARRRYSNVPHFLQMNAHPFNTSQIAVFIMMTGYVCLKDSEISSPVLLCDNFSSIDKRGRVYSENVI